MQRVSPHVGVSVGVHHGLCEDLLTGNPSTGLRCAFGWRTPFHITVVHAWCPGHGDAHVGDRA